MPARLTPVSQRELIEGLKTFGWGRLTPTAKHFKLHKLGVDKPLVIPNQHRQDIGSPLLPRILKQAGITREEWITRNS